MLFVAIGGNRHMLQRHRHLGRGDIAQLMKHRSGIFYRRRQIPPACPADSNVSTATETSTTLAKSGSGTFENAARRFLGVDFRIAFVAQNHEAETVGEFFQAAGNSHAKRPPLADWPAMQCTSPPYAPGSPHRAHRDPAGNPLATASSANRSPRNLRRGHRRHRRGKMDWASGSQACPCAPRHSGPPSPPRNTGLHGCH